MNGNTYNFGGESFERGNMYNENMSNNDRDEYDFPLDNDHCGNDEGIPSIARFVDGSGFLSSNKVLNTNEKDTNIERATPIGTTVANGRTSKANEVIESDKSPSMAMAQLEKNDELNDREQINVDKTSVKLEGGLGNKSSWEPNTLKSEANVARNNVGSHSMECGSPNPLHQD